MFRCIFRKKETVIHAYGIIIDRKYSIRDLGGTFTSPLSFNININDVYSSAMRAPGLLFRNTKSFQRIDVMLALFFTMVRSRVEYLSFWWDPIYNEDIILLERIQKRFLKHCNSRKYNYYPSRGCDYHEL